MSITKIWIEDGCICCGMSSATCPEVFEIPDDDDSNIVKKNVDFSLITLKYDNNYDKEH